MQFYSNSTQSPSCTSPQQQPSASSLQLPLIPKDQPVCFYFYNQYYHQFLSLSNQLNEQLLLNHSLIQLRTNGQDQPMNAQNCKNDCEVRTTDSNKNASQIQELMDYKREQNKMRRRRKRAESQEEDSYRPDDEDSKDMALHVSESKNIPKNYGKAILNYILRNEQHTKTVLARLGIDPQPFLDSLAQAKGNLNTINQLRSLWLESHNPYAKAYRIFSMEYLRKHCLPYIFNSRVENVHKHIKYRYKMAEGVSDPERFTHMKEF